MTIREEAFTAAFEWAPIGIALLTPDARVARANPMLGSLLGYRDDDWSELAPGAYCHPDDRAQEQARREQLIAGAAARVEAEARLLRRDGKVVPSRLTCALLRDAAGRPAHFILHVQDLTQHAAAESERLRAEKEIVLLNNVLEQRIRKRTAELEESNEDLRGFAYSLAHDLRAPLASIDGFSVQLERRLAGQLDDKSAHYLQRVRAGVRLMADLTEGLLALADLSHAPLLHQTVDLSAVARAIIERLREQQPAREVSCRIDETPLAQGDVRLLGNVLENLLGNAWKFSSRQARARIEFGGERWADGSYLYHVKDNGAGFDPAYAYKLFGPFQRLHTAAEFDGTGIGLAMVRKIVSRHGGRVWAESAPGEGASFFFTLNENGAQRVQPSAAR